jgi:putative sigma-54 modulation protein
VKTTTAKTKPAVKKTKAAAKPRPAAPKKDKKAATISIPSSMKLILTTHNLTLTDAIEAHIMSRIEQLGHLDPRALDCRVTIEQDHSKVGERKFKCAMRVTEPGPDLFAEDAESDLYAAIDLVAKKIEQQIRKRHSKFKARNHSEAAKSKRSRQESDI